MKRIIPDLHKYKLLDLVFEENEERTEENYLIQMFQLEKACEKFLLDIFKKLDFQAAVKTDKYSLPYQKEIEHTIKGTSFLNDAFDFRRVARSILKELLKEDIKRLRFYLFINVITFPWNASDVFPLKEKLRSKYNLDIGSLNIDPGAVEYRFRYYVHDRPKN